MSLKLLNRDYVTAVNALVALLEGKLTTWRLAQSEEDRLVSEADILSSFEKYLEGDYELEDVKVGSPPDVLELTEVYDPYEFMLRLNLAKLRKLREVYGEYYNAQENAMTSLIGKMTRVKQKLATLRSWGNAGARFSVAEFFLNYDKLGSEFTSESECEVNTSQGVMTLPVVSARSAVVKKVSIGEGSNGQAGNLDVQVTTNNIRPSAMLNGDASDWFEYERLDSGPCILELKCELSKEEIINHIEIEALAAGESAGYILEDVVYSNSTGIRPLRGDLSADLGDDFFTIKTVGDDLVWECSHLPVRARTILLRFVQELSSPIQVLTADKRTVERERFSIGIRSLTFHGEKYESAGGINSLGADLMPGLFSAYGDVTSWPVTESLYSLALSVSVDGGYTWINGGNPLAENEGWVSLSGNDPSIIWRLVVTRNDEVFETGIPDESAMVDGQTDSVLRSVSPNQSPVQIALPERPYNDEVYVFQPKVLRRGERADAVRIGSGASGDIAFDMPLDLVEHGIAPDDLQLFINRRQWIREDDNRGLGLGQWAFSDDYKRIEIGRAPGSSDIRALLDEELMNFEARSDGYYYYMQLPFDPDKNNIKVTYLPATPVRKSMFVPRNRKIFHLGARFIHSDGLQLSSSSGISYTEVTSRRALGITADSYYVDYSHGIIHFSEELGDDRVRVTFSHQTPTVLGVDDFEIVYDGAAPVGIRVLPQSFSALDVSEDISASVTPTLSVKTGRFSSRRDLFPTSTVTKTLSYENVVRGTVSVSGLFSGITSYEELEFIDGESEFHGLISMDHELTAAQTGVTCTFYLSAGAAWYKDFGVVFGNTTDFVTLKPDVASVTIAGDYFVADDGLVTVMPISGALAGGSTINYHYRDPMFDGSNKFSVDYSNGIVYTLTPMLSSGTISYKAASYKVGYDVSNEISEVSFDPALNAVAVRTENLKSINNLVKIVWKKPPVATELRDIKEYFSPLISSFDLRFY